MVIIETSAFTRAIRVLLGDDEYAQLQAFLVADPSGGAIIPGGGGVRKIRWAASGRGKSGGARIIYYWAVALGQIYMLRAYAKSDKIDLTQVELRALRRAVEEAYP